VVPAPHEASPPLALSFATKSATPPRRFIRSFEERVGLAPKRFARVRRFQRVLAAERAFDRAAIAAEVGYSDQAHLIHELALFAGEKLSSYPRADASNHVPLRE
jgi:AraC-like DNA-binding protein